MRAYEIITEREKLDEVFPLLGAGIWALVSWGFTVWSAYEIYKVARTYIDKTGGDPSKLTEDDYIDIAIGVLIAVLINKIPGAAGWVRRKFAKITPEEKAKVVGFVKPKVMDAFKKNQDLAIGVGATAVAVGQGVKK
jgi:hypothetical protein